MSEGSDLYLTADPARCLLLFGPEIWEPLKDKLLDLPRDLPQGGYIFGVNFARIPRC